MVLSAVNLTRSCAPKSVARFLADTLWLNPASVEFRISPSADLNGIVGGDWDIVRRRPFVETAKYRSMVQHFVEGLPWEQTDLFTDAYTRRMAKDGHIGGIRTMDGLAIHYRKRFDPMFDVLKREGFSLADAKGKPHPLPTILIGRSGELFIGNQGNHRMAMAKVIGLDRIAGRIVCRHSQTCR